MAAQTSTEHPVNDQERPWPWGPKLRDAREALGLSQRYAAKRAGISQTTWANLETGMVHLGKGMYKPYDSRASTVLAAASVVGLDPSEALRLTGHDPAEGPGFNPYGSPTVSQRQLADKLAALSEHQRALVVALIDELTQANAEPVPDTVVPSHERSAATKSRKRGARDSRQHHQAPLIPDL
ncbi:helix-turn-helix domain-containing protein [Saccharopolyspora tripterygii]